MWSATVIVRRLQHSLALANATVHYEHIVTTMCVTVFCLYKTTEVVTVRCSCMQSSSRTEAQRSTGLYEDARPVIELLNVKSCKKKLHVCIHTSYATTLRVYYNVEVNENFFP